VCPAVSRNVATDIPGATSHSLQAVEGLEDGLHATATTISRTEDEIQALLERSSPAKARSVSDARCHAASKCFSQPAAELAGTLAAPTAREETTLRRLKAAALYEAAGYCCPP
jgi:hypothetical protein